MEQNTALEATMETIKVRKEAQEMIFERFGSELHFSDFETSIVEAMGLAADMLAEYSTVFQIETKDFNLLNVLKEYHNLGLQIHLGFMDLKREELAKANKK